MQRRALIAGNWKMNLSLAEAVSLAKEIANGILDIEDRDVLIAPPFPFLYPINQILGRSKVYLGAQNMHWEKEGAFTGEVSGLMLKDVGCTHVIIGHSERRIIFKETDEQIAKKINMALEIGLYPILCVGEKLEEREDGKTFSVITSQLEGALGHLNDIPDSFVIAYEPVWAIGTGHTATPSQAQEVHSFIRDWIKQKFGEKKASVLRILYGGSVKPENIKDLMAEKDIDGALVGGASLKSDSFLKIIRYKEEV